MYQVTKEKYYQNLKKYYPDDCFTVLDPFTAATDQVIIRCDLCKQIYSYKRGTSLYNSNRKYLCKLCNTRAVKTLLKACEENNIEILERSNNTTDFWTLKCNKCGEIFKRAPSTWIQHSCPNCGHRSSLTPIEKREEEIRKKFGPEEFTVLDPSHQHFVIKHKCGYVRTTTYYAFMHSKGCPICARTLSKGEFAIMSFLERNHISYISHAKMGQTKQTFDFFFPQYNLALEFNGIQHYKPIKIFGGEERFIQQQQYDSNKIEYCKNNNIELKIISYLDFDNIEVILTDLFKKFNDQLDSVDRN